MSEGPFTDYVVDEHGYVVDEQMKAVASHLVDWSKAWAVTLGADMSVFEDYPVDEGAIEMFEDAARGNARIESLGAARVRLDDNPGRDDLVDRIKRKSAELIDLCGAMAKPGEYGEVARLTALAQTHYEIAAMLAVKAATAKR